MVNLGYQPPQAHNGARLSATRVVPVPLVAYQPQSAYSILQQSQVEGRNINLDSTTAPSYQVITPSVKEVVAPEGQDTIKLPPGPHPQKDIPSQRADDGITATIEKPIRLPSNCDRGAIGRPGPPRKRHPHRSISPHKRECAHLVANSKMFRLTEEHVKLIESAGNALTTLGEATKQENREPVQRVFSSKYSKLHGYGTQLGVTEVPDVGLVDGAISISRLLLHRMPLSVTYGNKPKFEGPQTHFSSQVETQTILLESPYFDEAPHTDRQSVPNVSDIEARPVRDQEMESNQPQVQCISEAAATISLDSPRFDDCPLLGGHRLPNVLGLQTQFIPDRQSGSWNQQDLEGARSFQTAQSMALDESCFDDVPQRQGAWNVLDHFAPDQESGSPGSSVRTLPGTPDSRDDEPRKLVQADSLPSFLGRGLQSQSDDEQAGERKPTSKLSEAMHVVFFEELRESLLHHLNMDAINTIFKDGMPHARDIFINGAHSEVVVCGHHNGSRNSRSVRPLSAMGLQAGTTIQALHLSWPAIGIADMELQVDAKQDFGCWQLGSCGQMGAIRFLTIPHRTLQVSLMLWSPPAAMRCMRIKEILDFFDEVPQASSIRNVVQTTVLPLTGSARCSYAEKNGSCGPPDVFISHSWDENVSQLRQAVLDLRPFLQASGRDSWKDSRAYMCAMTNNQHCINEELGDDFVDSSFAQALRAPSCRLFVLVGGHKLRAWMRAWCLLELAIAADSGKSILFSTPQGMIETRQMSMRSLEELEKRLQLIDISNAQCTSKEDLDKINALVQRQFGGTSRLNELVRYRLLSSVGLAMAQMQLSDASPVAHDSFFAMLSQSDVKLVNEIDIIIESTTLGSGSYGEVHKGTFKGIPVAVKQFNALELDVSGTVVSAQLQRLSQLAQHPNIVSMVACTISKHAQLSLALELVEGVSLARRLHSSGPALDVRRTLQGIAFGLAHLHSGLLAVVHGDLRPANVLLDIARGYEIPRISDFGLYIFKANDNVKNKVSVGQTHYRAPETLAQLGRRPCFSTKSDVFSYGVLSWHVASKKLPWQGYCEKDIRSMLLLGDRSGTPLQDIEDVNVRSLIQSCQAQDPHERPEMNDLLRNSSLY